MSLPLRIDILKYLKQEDAVDTKFDVGSKFLNFDDSRDARKNLSNALAFLKRENFIDLSGNPVSLMDTMAGQFGSKHHTNMMATITPHGDSYLKEYLATQETSGPINRKTTGQDIISSDTLIFISHSHKDKEIVSFFVDKILKLTLKIQSHQIFCTSLHETSIESGSDFRKAIKEKLQSASMVIQIISENYKQSEVCLNEMGAAWVLNGKVIPFIYSPIDDLSIGFIHRPNQILKLDRKEDILKFIDEEKQIENNIKHVEIERHCEDFVTLVKQYVVDEPKPIVKPKVKDRVNGLELEENDLVKIKNREGFYMVQNQTLIHISDDSKFSLFVYGFNVENAKEFRYEEVKHLIEYTKTIPFLKNCETLVDQLTHKKWMIIQGERRALPDSVYKILLRASYRNISKIEHLDLLKIPEGDRLNDTKGHFA